MTDQPPAPLLPPVLIDQRGSQAGYLNIGMTAANAARLCASRPEAPAQIISDKSIVNMFRWTFLLLVAGVASLGMPMSPARTLHDLTWVLIGTGAGIAVFIVAIEVGRAIQRRRYARALTSWESRPLSVMSELTLNLDGFGHHPHWPDANELIKALETARARILDKGDRHAVHPAEPELLHALAAVGRYAEDPEPTQMRKDAAHQAVTRFERTAIELIAKERRP